MVHHEGTLGSPTAESGPPQTKVRSDVNHSSQGHPSCLRDGISTPAHRSRTRFASSTPNTSINAEQYISQP